MPTRKVSVSLYLVVTSVSRQQLHITASLRRSVPPFSSFAPAKPSHQKGVQRVVVHLKLHTSESVDTYPKSSEIIRPLALDTLSASHANTWASFSFLPFFRVGVFFASRTSETFSCHQKRNDAKHDRTKNDISKRFCLSTFSHSSSDLKKSLFKDSRLFRSKQSATNLRSPGQSRITLQQVSCFEISFSWSKHVHPASSPNPLGERATKLRLWTIHSWTASFPYTSCFPFFS